MTAHVLQRCLACRVTPNATARTRCAHCRLSDGFVALERLDVDAEMLDQLPWGDARIWQADALILEADQMAAHASEAATGR